ncbi:GAP family protein [Streptomyces sp. NPDC006879]|uniref:GAP family protein n=1 Tax=Streptomyces sp. NPDC006879 TaxID=3364767 RepID=UPI0036C4E30D
MVLDLLLVALAITLDPLPIMAFVLVISATRGTWNGLAFILAWLACLVAVIALVMLATGGEPPAPRSPPSTAALAAKLTIGVGLVGYGEIRRRRFVASRSSQPPHGSSNEPAESRLNRLTPWSAAGLAVFLQPWGLVAAGAVTVVDADLSHAYSFAALLGFCLLATGSLLAAEVYTLIAPDAAALRLRALRSWMAGHKDQAIVGICLFLGLWLTAKAIYGLTG